jgi:hypothetical protein
MVRTFHSSGPTVTTTIGFLIGGGEVALEMVGHNLFVTIDGERIAKRERAGAKSKVVKYWIPVNHRYTVTDTDHPLEIEIEHDGVRLEWASRAGLP